MSNDLNSLDRSIHSCSSRERLRITQHVFTSPGIRGKINRISFSTTAPSYELMVGNINNESKDKSQRSPE